MTGILNYATAATPTTLSTGLSSATPGTTGTVVVLSNSNWPSRFPFTIIVEWGTANAEVITVTQAATGSGPFTYANCVRGDDGSNAPAHLAGVSVTHGVSGRDFLKGASDWINVTSADYGAVADNGVTDNLAAFNAAATAAAAAGTAIYIPGSTSGYGLSADWLVPAGVRVFGAGAYSLKTPGSTVPSAGGFFGSVLMPTTTTAAFTNAVVVLNGTSSSLENICVVGNIQGWTAGNAPSSHNAARCIQVAAKGCRLTHVHAWGGLASGVDVGTGAGTNEGQDADLFDVEFTNNLNPAVVLNVSGCSWINTQFTLTTTGNFITSGVFVGMYLSPTINGISPGTVVTAVSTTTLTVSQAFFNTNAGPVSVEFLGGAGLRVLASSDVMVADCRTSSSFFVCAGGNTDMSNNHWSAGVSGSSTYYLVYADNVSGNKFTGDVFDCATACAGQVRRNRGNVILAGCRFQNLNTTSTTIPMLVDNEASGVTVQGAFQLFASEVTTSNIGSPDGFSYLINFAGSGNPALAIVNGLAVDASAVQHSPTLYSGGTPGVSRAVQVGSTLIETPYKSNLNLYIAPTNATAETVPRGTASATRTAGISGTLYLMAIGLNIGTVINTLTFFTGSTAESGGSDGWYVLLDSGLVVRAVSANQTGATFWGATTSVPLAMTSGGTYTTTYSGLYYVGYCIVASGMPTFIGPASLGGNVNAVTPIMAASSSTGLSTPPALGTTMGALSASGSVSLLYAYTS